MITVKPVHSPMIQAANLVPANSQGGILSVPPGEVTAAQGAIAGVVGGAVGAVNPFAGFNLFGNIEQDIQNNAANVAIWLILGVLLLIGILGLVLPSGEGNGPSVSEIAELAA